MGSGSEIQIVGAANENDLQSYFFNFVDGTAYCQEPLRGRS